jgi:two-component system cell cycle sensor histidine kinase/response regulator CckA
VKDMEKMLRRSIPESIQLVTRLDPDLGAIKVDQSQLEQVIVNLAVNARDAMPRGGTLTLRTANRRAADAEELHTKETQQYVTLAVEDTGAGMDEQTKARIFEPFFTTKERGKGTGLGLATVYGIIKQSGGSIVVESAPDRGSVFTIAFPKAEAPLPSRIAEDAERLPAHFGETILLVEDEPAVRKLASITLRQQGYTVLEAADGPSALHLERECKMGVDLLVTDVVMPGIDGCALAERLTAIRPELKVLYLSGYTEHALSDRHPMEPGKAFLQKPFSPRVLALKVRELLDHKGPHALLKNPSLIA